MRVKVDPDTCQAHAQCVITAPAVFALDDEGDTAVVLQDPVTAEMGPLVEAAVRACPVQAISIIDDTDG